MQTAAPLPWLEASDGSRLVLSGTSTIGRSPENTLVLENDQVSRRHAILQAQGENEFWLVDLGSANGSYVNGRRVAQPVRLHSGDVIRLSGVEMEFHAGATGQAAKALPIMASTMISVKTAECWMLMADIIGSTRLAQEVSPEELPRITGGWFKNCREIIEAHGGHIMKYLGDGFFCYWEPGPERASQIQQALTVLRALQETATPAFRMVLHHGQAVLGSVPTLAELNLHGPEVNFTFRIEKIAGTLNLPLMLSEPASKRLGLPVRHVHTCAVDGFSKEFRFYCLA